MGASSNLKPCVALHGSGKNSIDYIVKEGGGGEVVHYVTPNRFDIHPVKRMALMGLKKA